jgi:large subunit ribosomal protein L31
MRQSKPVRGRCTVVRLSPIIAGCEQEKLLEHAMKEKGHPKYADIAVTCSCGNTFTTRSTLGRPLHVEVCSACHPFYTGKQKIVDTAGRVERFKQKYARTGSAKAA